MKALIFNSGLGSRLGELTKDRPKAMVRLGNGETIFHRQLRILAACGVSEFVVTTGPYAEQLEEVAEEFKLKGCTFAFVRNEAYQKTNYIYSMYLAKEHLRGGSFLVLHGDLVFDAAYVKAVMESSALSVGSASPSDPLPEKDFKARVANGMIAEVSVGIFDDGCVAFQPFYKLSEKALGMWLDEVERFVERGEVGVYAENAANKVFAKMGVSALSYEGHFVEEVDTPEDLQRVSSAIRLLDFNEQPVFAREGGALRLGRGFFPGDVGGIAGVAGVLSALGATRPMVVSGRRFSGSGVEAELSAAGMDCALFSDFAPNPSYEQVLSAVALFKSAGCDSLLSVGGGSAIDVAKCVKAFAPMGGDGAGGAFAENAVPFSGIVHVAVPTTAGTGSESTHFAVCYAGGAKKSVAGDALLPDAAVLDAGLLATLPDYQRKCTLLDALCQAIESHWSARSCAESRRHSSRAIPMIVGCWEEYLSWDGSSEGPGAKAARSIMDAANLAGKAINVTTTTAAHAMSYGLTSLFGIPHGHAVAMCLPPMWRLLLERGDAAVLDALADVARLMGGGVSDPASGLAEFERVVSGMGIATAVEGSADDISRLVSSVNAQRLSNFPLVVSGNDLEEAFCEIVAPRGGI